MAVLLATAAGLYFSGLAQRGWNLLLARRAERFTHQGYEAWQAGRTREAELLFASAITADPAARRARLLNGRMFLQTGRVAEARALFAQRLAVETDALRLDTASIYFDALVATASFAELARFAVEEQSRLPASLQAQWGGAAIEATRLARLSPSADVLAGPTGREAPTALAALLAAQQCANGGQTAAALAWLARVEPAQLTGSLQLSAVRLAMELDGSNRARQWLNSVGRVLDDSELAFNELWLGQTVGGEDPAMAAKLIPAAFPPGLSGPLLFQRVGRLLIRPAPALPRLLSAHLQSRTTEMSTEQLSALWLIWELNRPGERDNPWTVALADRIHFTPLPRPPGEFNVRQLMALLNSLPLARDTVVSLLVRVPTPAT